MKPFRWNLEKREQLGRLVEGTRSPANESFEADVQSLSSRVVACSGDATLVFVGRSPESLFDYLSGIVLETIKSDDLRHLNISNRFATIEDLEKTSPGSTEVLNNHFEDCELSPLQIHQRKKQTLCVDLVCEGGTFEQLATFLFSWAREEAIPSKEFRKKLGFIGITIRTKTSPNTWRWQQQSPWVEKLGVQNIQNLSIDRSFWCFLGNAQQKVTPSHSPNKWLTDEALAPPRSTYALEALRRAYDLFELGRATKTDFAQLLSQDKAVKEKWLRTFIGNLKAVG